MSYEWYRPTATTGSPTVSICRDGLFLINRLCMEQYFKGVSLVKLGFDCDRKIIALRPEKRGDVCLRRVGKGRGMVTAAGFLHKFGIDHSQATSFSPHWNKGQLEIQLGDALLS